jgi:hypothetical protein
MYQMNLSYICCVSQCGKWLSSAGTDFSRILRFTRTVRLPDLNRQQAAEWRHHCHCPSFCSKEGTVLFVEALLVKKRELSLRRMVHRFKIPTQFVPPNRKQDHFTTSTSFPTVNNLRYCGLLGCDISKYGRWSPCSCRLQIADDVSAMTWAEEQKRVYECKSQHSDCGTAFMLQRARKWCSLYVNWHSACRCKWAAW